MNNTLWFENGGIEYDETRLDELATGLANYWVTAMMPFLSEEIVFRGAIAYAQFSESAPAIDHAVTPTPGGVASPSVQNNVTWCVKFNTAGRGKSFRGRNYVPGIPQESVAANEVGAGYAGSLVSVYNGLAGAVDLSGFAHVVVSHFTAGAPRVAGLVSAVTSCSYSDLVVDSQRRRLPGRGT